MTTPSESAAPLVLQHGLATAEFLPDTYPCFFNPALRWDGWYLPYFSLQTGLQLVQDLPGLRYDATRDGFVWPDDERGNTFLAVEIAAAGVIHKVYPIGQYNMYWSCSRRFRNEAGETFHVEADGSLRGEHHQFSDLAALGGEVDLMDDLPS